MKWFLAATLLAGASVVGALAQTPSWRAQYISADAPVIALVNARVIDGTGAAPVDGQTVLIRDGRIEAVGPSVPVPDGATSIDLTGKTVMPGLVMLHEHMMYFSGRAVWHAQPVSYPKLYLAAGVTTLRTAGAEHPEVDLNLKRRIDSGLTPGPKTHLTGPYFNGAAGDFLGDTVVSTPEEGRAATAYWAGRGFTSFKLYDALTAPVARAVIDEAHARGLTVTGHLGALGCSEAAALGIDFIEHGFASCSKDLAEAPDATRTKPDASSPAVRTVIDALLRARVVLVMTPSNIERRISDEELAMLHPVEKERYLRLYSEKPPWLPNAGERAAMRKLDRAYADAGGRIGVGADAMDFGLIAGYANHRALALLVEEGWSPLEAIRLATSNGAALLGVDKETGTIRPGLAADLLVVDGDPSVDIADLARVHLVFKDGDGYDPRKLRAAARGLVGWH